MEKRNFVTIADLDKDRLLYLLKMAEEFERHPDRELLKGTCGNLGYIGEEIIGDTPGILSDKSALMSSDRIKVS